MERTNLPIFTNITDKLAKKKLCDITTKMKEELCSNIEKYRDTHEIIYAIIRLYQIKNSTNIYNTPYNCKYLKTKKGYKFDLEIMPNRLVHMLIEFYDIHIRSENQKKGK